MRFGLAFFFSPSLPQSQGGKGRETHEGVFPPSAARVVGIKVQPGRVMPILSSLRLALEV